MCTLRWSILLFWFRNSLGAFRSCPWIFVYIHIRIHMPWKNFHTLGTLNVWSSFTYCACLSLARLFCRIMCWTKRGQAKHICSFMASVSRRMWRNADRSFEDTLNQVNLKPNVFWSDWSYTTVSRRKRNFLYKYKKQCTRTENHPVLGKSWITPRNLWDNL